MTAMDVREPVNGTAIHRAGRLVHRCHDSSLEEAAIDVLARTLCRAATPTGSCAQDLLTRLSDDDLSALYVSCARRICGLRGPCPVTGKPEASPLPGLTQQVIGQKQAAEAVA
ncbi:hypothetical protein ABZY14_09095 [Streptomyces sp. NPDC006617]|uniref:hypothetical protein n=1 Tax=Streptomyces sp. NPDC006617 TaxID=3155354 RepID=UPI0033BC63DF